MKPLEVIEELKAEIKVSDELLKGRDALLEAIPQCIAHGKCVPHALEWIEQMKLLPNNKKICSAEIHGIKKLAGYTICPDCCHDLSPNL